MLAVKRLAEMQRSSDGRGSLRKKPPPITQQQEVMSMDSPPPDGEIIQEKSACTVLTPSLIGIICMFHLIVKPVKK